MTTDKIDFSYIQATYTELTIYPDKQIDAETIFNSITKEMWNISESEHNAERQIPLDGGNEREEVKRMGTMNVDIEHNVITITSQQPVDSRLLYHSITSYLSDWNIDDDSPMTSRYNCSFSHPLVSFDRMITWCGLDVEVDDIGKEYVQFDINDEKHVRMYETGDMYVFGGTTIELANEGLKVINKEINSHINSQSNRLLIDELPSGWANPLCMLYPTSLIEDIVWEWERVIEELNDSKRSVSLIFDSQEVSNWSKAEVSRCLLDVMTTLMYTISIMDEDGRKKFYDRFTEQENDGEYDNVFIDLIVPLNSDTIEKEVFVEQGIVDDAFHKSLLERKRLLELVINLLHTYDEYGGDISTGQVFKIEQDDGSQVAVQIGYQDTISELSFPHEPVWWGRITSVKKNSDDNKIGNEVLFDPSTIKEEVKIDR